MVKQRWVVTAKRADFEAISKQFNIDPVLARILRNRDLLTSEDIERFLSGDMNSLRDPHLLKDIDKAALILKEKIKEKKKIRIIGDYDVDGICSTYILLKGLKVMGADVDTVIPHRIKDGYGLNDNLINSAHEDGIDTILTCDNGISAFDQVELAKSLNMDVIITDHHEVPYEMDGDKKRYIVPDALAVVDPKQEDCKYPFKSICGAFVSFKLISIMLGGEHDEVIEELIPFAAMATVCDVMELLDENRVIVKEGIKRMSNPVNIGLKALCMVTGLKDKDILSYHFGFVLGPTINATGRLDTAKRALELFSTDSFNEASIIATQLKELNDSRKAITEEGTQKASEIIDNSSIKDDRVLVIYLEDTHESIAGIIAGRIKEKYYKPTIVLTEAEDGIKGSGRSIEDYDMYEELTKVKHIFTKYGGHKMAAGVSLANKGDVETLRKLLNENCILGEKELTKKLVIDVPMPLSYINMNLVESFSMLEPCGVGNPKPMFATSNVSLLSYEKRGKQRVIGKLKVKDEAGRRFDMVYFDSLEDFDTFLIDNFGQEKFDELLNGRCRDGDINIKLAYYPDINEYNNIRTIQIVMKYYDV